MHTYNSAVVLLRHVCFAKCFAKPLQCVALDVGVGHRCKAVRVLCLRRLDVTPLSHCGGVDVRLMWPLAVFGSAASVVCDHQTTLVHYLESEERPHGEFVVDDEFRPPASDTHCGVPCTYIGEMPQLQGPLLLHRDRCNQGAMLLGRPTC